LIIHTPRNSTMVAAAMIPDGFDPVAGSPPTGTTAGTTDAGSTTTVVVAGSTTVGSVEAGAALVGAIATVVVGAAVVVVAATVVVVGAAVVVVGAAVVVVGFAVVVVGFTVVDGSVRTKPPAANAVDGMATATHTSATPKIVLLTCSPYQLIRHASAVDTHRGLVEIGWNLLHKTHKLELARAEYPRVPARAGIARAEGVGATSRHRNPLKVIRPNGCGDAV
jgi:hypothetical protein